MSVIDCHHHFWWTARRPHRWPEGAGDRLARDFTPDDLKPELARCGIDGTILVQVAQEIAETEEFLDLTHEHAFVRGVVGWVPLSDPAACEKALGALRRRGPLVGIRHLIAYEPDPQWILQPPVLDSLKQLACAGLVFEGIPVNDQQLLAVLEAARRVPDLQLVINHLGRPPVPEQGWEPWAARIVTAAENPNVSMKLSVGLDMVLRWRWSTDMLRRYADHVLEQLGPDRVMAASNWPVILLGASFPQAWRGISDLVGGLADAERRAVLGGTAERIYGLKP
jgi:L-fuconolactonase